MSLEVAQGLWDHFRQKAIPILQEVNSHGYQRIMQMPNVSAANLDDMGQIIQITTRGFSLAIRDTETLINDYCGGVLEAFSSVLSKTCSDAAKQVKTLRALQKDWNSAVDIYYRAQQSYNVAMSDSAGLTEQEQQDAEHANNENERRLENLDDLFSRWTASTKIPKPVLIAMLVGTGIVLLLMLSKRSR